MIDGSAELLEAEDPEKARIVVMKFFAGYESRGRGNSRSRRTNRRTAVGRLRRHGFFVASRKSHEWRDVGFLAGLTHEETGSMTKTSISREESLFDAAGNCPTRFGD